MDSVATDINRIRKPSVINRVISAEEVKNGTKVDSELVTHAPLMGRRWSTPNAHMHIPALSIDRKNTTHSANNQPTGNALDAANTILAMVMAENRTDDLDPNHLEENKSLVFEQQNDISPMLVSMSHSAVISPARSRSTSIYNPQVQSPGTKAVFELNTHMAMVTLLERSNHWNWDMLR